MAKTVRDLNDACKGNKANFDEEKRKLSSNSSHEDIKMATDILLKLRTAADHQTKKEKAEAYKSKANHQTEIERIIARGSSCFTQSVAKSSAIKLDKVENI